MTTLIKKSQRAKINKKKFYKKMKTGQQGVGGLGKVPKLTMM